MKLYLLKGRIILNANLMSFLRFSSGMIGECINRKGRICLFICNSNVEQGASLALSSEGLFHRGVGMSVDVSGH